MKINAEETLLYHADKIIDLCNRRDIKQFDGFVPIIPELYDEGYIIFADAKPSDLSSKVDISALRLGQPDKSGASKEAQFHHLKSLSAKELRKRTGIFALNPFSLDVAFERYPKVTDIFLQSKKSGFVPLEIPNYRVNQVVIKEAMQSAQMLLGIQFNLENQCYVYLRPDGATIGFKYPIDDLQQLKELFALRDIPDGRKRRVALRHWVAKHLRKKPSNPEEKVEVKRHLRGKQDFKWFGISGTIFVN